MCRVKAGFHITYKIYNGTRFYRTNQFTWEQDTLREIAGFVFQNVIRNIIGKRIHTFLWIHNY